MNNPIKMYRTKQIVQHNLPVQLPNCMYKLNNIHSGRNGMVDGSSDHVSSPNKKLDIIDQVKQFLKNNPVIPGMAELELKQEEILKQLAELKEQILTIKSNLNLNVGSTQKSPSSVYTETTKKEFPEDIPEIVLNINPNNPPYSLLVVQKLLQDVVTLKVTSHYHSTVSFLPDNAKKVNDDLLNFQMKANVCEINLKLIWKNISSNLELLISFVPIFGEVNLLRYLANAFPSILNYNHEEHSVEVDSVLDLCHQIIKSRTKTEKTSLLQILNKALGKSQWLLGRNNPSIADIAAYSAIQQVCASSDLSVNLGKWFQRCVNCFMSS